LGQGLIEVEMVSPDHKSPRIGGLRGSTKPFKHGFLKTFLTFFTLIKDKLPIKYRKTPIRKD
jgi:hypothetical protein